MKHPVSQFEWSTVVKEGRGKTREGIVATSVNVLVKESLRCNKGLDM